MNERNHPDLATAARRLFGRRVEQLGAIERDVLSHAVHGKPVSRDTNQAFEGKLTLGARVADRVDAFGGSWTFIIGFLIFLAFWTFANTLLPTRDALDPYPFIFLNLILSMLAALQAPIIMMSQNRQSA